MRIVVVSWEAVKRLIDAGRHEYPEAEDALNKLQIGLDLFDIECEIDDFEVRQLIEK